MYKKRRLSRGGLEDKYIRLDSFAEFYSSCIESFFTGEGCVNCKMLIREVKDLMSKNSLISENIFVEVVDGDATEFRDIMIAHDVQMLPLSILHDPEGKEVWSASGFHGINEVKKELELIATPN